MAARRRGAALRALAAIACAGVAASLVSEPAAAAPSGPLPILASVPSVGLWASGNSATGPGYANAGSGLWYFATPSTELATVRVPSQGVPVWGDWDGDGMPTPGRYTPEGHWLLANQRIGTAVLTDQAAYGGLPGDVPVSGDWDGDGRDNVGVFRAGTFFWLLPDGSSSLVTLGAAGDTPVVGDWDGDGRLDVGVVRSAVWTLQVRAGSTAPAGLLPWARARRMADGTTRFTFTFGRASDAPVVGDWDGDRITTPGVVRAGSTWLMVSTWKQRTAPLQRTFTMPRGTVPLAAPTARDYARGRCPTASPALTRHHRYLVSLVAPPAPLAPPAPPAGSAPDPWLLTRSALRDQARYLVRYDLTSRLASQRSTPYIDMVSRNAMVEHTVRRLGNAAVTVALARATGALSAANGPGDPASAAPPVEDAAAAAYVAWLVRSVACQNLATSPGGWGHGFQSALWAYVTGLAAWYSWGSLPVQVRGYVAAMLVDEANHVSRRDLGYWKDREGGFTGDAGNTRAEDVTWDGMVLALASVMMPGHGAAPQWRAGVVQRAIAGYAMPRDLTDATAVNGIVPSTFLNGTNAFDDGTVVNHGVINPDYMAAIGQNWVSALTFAAGRRPAPVALWRHGAHVYGALASVTFPTANAPTTLAGGPIYQADGSIFFPDKVSWGSKRRGIWVATDAMASALRVDDRAVGFLRLHAMGQRQLQARFTDGRTYSANLDEDVYAGGREEYNGQQLAMAYWARVLTAAAPVQRDESDYGPGGQ